MNHSWAVSAFVSVAMIATACSESDSPAATEVVHTVAPVTDAPTTAPARTDPPATDPLTTDAAAPGLPITDPAELVTLLASDELNGRDNQSEGSAAARDLIVTHLSELAAPAVPDQEGGLDFFQEYDLGTNIVGVVPGRGQLANEYVMIGAHYDHLAPGECDVRDQVDDVICNGAADNAAGVASVMTIVGRMQGDVDRGTEDSGRRGLIVSFWDGEEDDLDGSRHYVSDPVIPLDQTVAYVNFDIQGASLLPEMVNRTVLVGPETGGPVLVDAAARATGASSLDYATLSLIFGQGRSDHAVLVDAGVPSVFFTDANNGCYHTVLDDIDHYEPEKHLLEIDTAEALVRDLSGSTERPRIVVDVALTSYSDAEQLLSLVKSGGTDLASLPDGGVAATAYLSALDAIVGAGVAAYDDAAAGVVLGGAATLVGDLADGECRLP